MRLVLMTTVTPDLASHAPFFHTTSTTPDGEQDTMLELGSDVPAYCLQAPTEWTKVRRAVCRSVTRANET
ncbi:hypothetical protein TNCV_1009211 [Trichonephila clavipes]|nr:hypothetical protein TNCV_1009211 [Trichonephila clavipes]